MIQALATAARPEDAEWLWKTSQELPKSLSDYELLARLSTFPTVASEVKDKIARALESSELGIGDLYSVANVDDPRVLKWFKSMVDSPDPRVRAIARKVVGRDKRLPRGVQYAAAPPQRRGELFSTEVDIDKAEVLLKKLAKDLHLKIPLAVRTGRFLSRLAADRWAVAEIHTESGDLASIWFRLEDVNTVEITVMPGLPIRQKTVQTIH